MPESVEGRSRDAGLRFAKSVEAKPGSPFFKNRAPFLGRSGGRRALCALSRADVSPSRRYWGSNCPGSRPRQPRSWWNSTAQRPVSIKSRRIVLAMAPKSPRASPARRFRAT